MGIIEIVPFCIRARGIHGQERKSMVYSSLTFTLAAVASRFIVPFTLSRQRIPSGISASRVLYPT